MVGSAVGAAAASWVRIAVRSTWIFRSASPQTWAGGPVTPGAATQPVRLNRPTSSASRAAMVCSAPAPFTDAAAPCVANAALPTSATYRAQSG